jgi:hypothetical protein
MTDDKIIIGLSYYPVSSFAMEDIRSNSRWP